LIARKALNKSQIVIPAHAGIQSSQTKWIPAFARMTLDQTIKGPVVD
jgi:hypothetical protein